MTADVLRIGTRASALALAQSREVGETLTAGTGTGLDLVHVHTQGDADRTSPLATIGGTGVFVSAVRQALLDGEVDLVVHSFKDLPTAPADGILLGAVPRREDPRDALCARDGMELADLPLGARVGTGSPRRAAQLLRARPDLDVIGIRGNIDTRLARALGPDADLHAVVLAAAGLRRLDRTAAISQLLEPDVMLPAPAQGALALEVRSPRSEDPASAAELVTALSRIDDAGARAAVTAERAVLRRLEAGCSAPVAAYGQIGPDGDLHLRALAIGPDGSEVVSGSLTGDAGAADELGVRLAEQLLENGADRLLQAGS